MKNFQIWLKEIGSGPYIGNGKSTSDYIVLGACSDLKKKSKKKFKEWLESRINKDNEFSSVFRTGITR